MNNTWSTVYYVLIALLFAGVLVMGFLLPEESAAGYQGEPNAAEYPVATQWVREDWIRATPGAFGYGGTRLSMVKDMTERVLYRGLPLEEVQELLGPWDRHEGDFAVFYELDRDPKGWAKVLRIRLHLDAVQDWDVQREPLWSTPADPPDAADLNDDG